jgi:outer membrane protein OmpA-like peptidoglycan-associated protein
MQGHNRVTGRLLQVTAAIALASGLGACSIVPDWADPTTWFGDDQPSAADASGKTPDLADLPNKPDAAGGTQNVASSLVADRSQVQYSGDALRAGSINAASPPPDLSAGDASPANAALPALAPTGSGATAASASPDQSAQASRVDKSVTPNPVGSSLPGALPSVGTPVAPVAEAAPTPSRVQTSELPAGTQPSLPPAVADTERPAKKVAKHREPKGEAPAFAERETVTAPASHVAPEAPVVAAQDPSDAALGFKPSSAPPLDPSVSEFVAAPIVQHYRQTASMAGASSAKASTRVGKVKSHRHAEGGPDVMEGKVVANMDVIQNPSGPVYADAQGQPATAVVYFPGDRVSLDAEARAQVVDIAAQFKARSGTGFVKVVGHSSSRTPDMPVDKHLNLIFKKSQDRANAVAQALIRAGVPADKILVEAVGDSQPIFFESMPKGEDGNRRAEIFLQG